MIVGNVGPTREWLRVTHHPSDPFLCCRRVTSVFRKRHRSLRLASSGSLHLVCVLHFKLSVFTVFCSPLHSFLFRLSLIVRCTYSRRSAWFGKLVDGDVLVSIEKCPKTTKHRANQCERNNATHDKMPKVDAIDCQPPKQPLLFLSSLPSSPPLLSLLISSCFFLSSFHPTW